MPQEKTIFSTISKELDVLIARSSVISEGFDKEDMVVKRIVLNYIYMCLSIDKKIRELGANIDEESLFYDESMKEKIMDASGYKLSVAKNTIDKMQPKEKISTNPIAVFNYSDFLDYLNKLDMGKLLGIMGIVEGDLMYYRATMDALNEEYRVTSNNPDDGKLFIQLLIMKHEAKEISAKLSNLEKTDPQTFQKDYNHSDVIGLKVKINELYSKLEHTCYNIYSHSEEDVNAQGYICGSLTDNTNFYHTSYHEVENEYINAIEEKKYEQKEVLKYLSHLRTGNDFIVNILESGIGMVNPVYKIKILEDKIKIGKTEFKKLKQSQGFDWARKVAHEIGGPIETVRDNIKLIQNYLEQNNLLHESLIKGSDKRKFKIVNTIGRMLDSTKVITNIIKGVSDYGKLTRPEKTEIHSKEFQDILNNLFDKTFKDDSVSIKYSMEECVLLVDKSLFMRVFENLFENSKKYGFDGFEGKKEIQISIRCDPKLNNIILTFFNSGNAVKCTEIDYWEQFKTEDKQKGSGLGMSIVKEIIESHDGVAKLEPESFTSGHKITIQIPRQTKEKENG